MTITVDIRHEVQAEIARQAAAIGGGSNQERLENTLQEMGQFSEKIPSLPDEAFTRDRLYRDHD